MTEMSSRKRWELAQAGKFDELPPEHLHMYQLCRWKALASELTELEVINNIWICGPPNTGV